MRIAGRRALVTGASRGIGADLARGLASAGADVALVARGAPGLEALAEEIDGIAYPADLTDYDQLRGLFERVEQDGPVDILVNNAGDEKVGAFEDMDADALAFLVALNVTAVAELQRQAIPRMLLRGRGHIVNVSSFAGVICAPHLATYAATKAFITHHTVNLAFELRGTPINFTKVEVGEVAETGLIDKVRTDPTFAAFVQRLYRWRLSRLVTPQEITTKTLAAIEHERHSVRIPRRTSGSSLMVDGPRVLSGLIARGLPT